MKRFDVYFVMELIGFLGLCRGIQAEPPSPAPLYQMQSRQKTQVDWSGLVLAPGSKTDIVDLKDPGVSSLPDIQDAEIRTAGFTTEPSPGTKSDLGAAPPP